MILVHGTCVDLIGGAVLLRGRPGSGKSDLALRLIEDGGMLVADDQVVLQAAGGRLVAGPPDALAGLLEVRGIGIVRQPFRLSATLRCVIDLVSRDEIERLPEPEMEEFCGLRIPRFRLDAFTASAPAKVRLASRTNPAVRRDEVT